MIVLAAYIMPRATTPPSTGPSNPAKVKINYQLVITSKEASTKSGCNHLNLSAQSREQLSSHLRICRYTPHTEPNLLSTGLFRIRPQFLQPLIAPLTHRVRSTLNFLHASLMHPLLLERQALPANLVVMSAQTVYLSRPGVRLQNLPRLPTRAHFKECLHGRVRPSACLSHFMSWCKRNAMPWPRDLISVCSNTLSLVLYISVEGKLKDKCTRSSLKHRSAVLGNFHRSRTNIRSSTSTCGNLENEVLRLGSHPQEPPQLHNCLLRLIPLRTPWDWTRRNALNIWRPFLSLCARFFDIHFPYVEYC